MRILRSKVCDRRPTGFVSQASSEDDSVRAFVGVGTNGKEPAGRCRVLGGLLQRSRIRVVVDNVVNDLCQRVTTRSGGCVHHDVQRVPGEGVVKQ